MKKIIIENFTISPEKGFVALAIGISKEGYRIKNIERKGTKAIVTFEEK